MSVDYEGSVAANDLETLVNDTELVGTSGVRPVTRLHDICVQDVRYFCRQDIDICLPIPAVGEDSVGNSCRGEISPITPNYRCSVNVICAEEQLANDCKGIDISLGLQITLTPPNPLVLPVTIINHYVSFCFRTFIPFPSGHPIGGKALANALKTIDGSCIVVQNLCCEILNGQCTRIRVTGELIDKLWKHENLWVQAARPYGGVTVRQEFPEPHAIGPCQVCDCDVPTPSL